MKNIDTACSTDYVPKDLQDYHLGPAIALKTYVTSETETGLREHRLHQIEVDGVSHRILETEPSVSGSEGLTIVSKRGFGEHIDSRIGLAFHARLAAAMPDARIISHATHGIGSHTKGSLRQFSAYGLAAIANQGLKLLDACCHGEQVILVGTSMGTAVTNKLVNLNTKFSNPVDIVGVVLNAPAIVRPERIVPVMVRQFLPALISDLAMEIATRTPRDHIVQTLGNLVASHIFAQDLPAAGHQLFDLLHGTPESDKQTMLETTKTSVIIGINDPVSELADWQSLEPYYPNLTVHTVHKGHNMIFKPHENADKIVKTLVKDGHYRNARTAA